MLLNTRNSEGPGWSLEVTKHEVITACEVLLSIDIIDAHILCLILHMVWDFNEVLCICSSCIVCRFC